MQPIREPELNAGLIRERADRLMARLTSAAEAANRDPQGFRVVAVTKGFGVPIVLAAREAGLTLFGENRVQEAEPKVEALADAEWHLVGRLQSNKARRASQLFAAIHSVDSVGLLERLERIAHDHGRHPLLFLQVNVSDEPTKGGFDSAWFGREASGGGELVRALRALRHCRVVGLMTMAREGANAAEQRAAFARLRDLRGRLQEVSGLTLPELSMGMTADAEAAVAEGATLVRIGTALFGPRPHA